MAGRHRKVPQQRGAHGHHGRHRKPPTRQRAVLPTATAVAVLAVGGVVFGHAIASGQAPHGAAVATPPTPAVVPPVIATAPTAPTAPTRPAKHKNPPNPKPSRRAAHHRTAPALVISDTGSPCYIQVTTSHGQLLTRRILHHGDHVAFRRHGLDVVLGNAGGVKIAVNGHRAHRAGRSGQVRVFRVR
jgi:cytoskeleton protein RodZ